MFKRAVFLCAAAGVYGDVIRVKILFNKKDTALIQFVDAVQAARGTPKCSQHFSVSISFLFGKVKVNLHTLDTPRVGSGVVRIDPLRFLAGCRTR